MRNRKKNFVYKILLILTDLFIKFELLKKFNLTEVVKIVHSLTGISKKEIYQIAIQLKND